MKSFSDLIAIRDVHELRDIGHEPLPEEPRTTDTIACRVSQTNRLIERILRRKRAKRVYIAEQHYDATDARSRLEEAGRDLLSVGLSDAGIVVVDAETIRAFLCLSLGVPDLMKTARNPCHQFLFREHLVSEVYIPAGSAEDAKHKALIAYAQKSEIAVVQWHVELELVLRHRESKTPQ